MGDVVLFARGRMSAGGVVLMSKAHGFYTAREAARISGVPLQRLYAWRRAGIIVPRVVVEDDEGREEAGYDFEAIVYLRLLRLMREQGISLLEAVKALKHLRDRFGAVGPAWENARLFKHGSKVIVYGPDEWQDTVASQHGQRLIAELFGQEFALLRERADALLIPRRFLKVVQINPEVRSGLPVVRDTTLPTSLIYSLYQQGYGVQSIREAYPTLSLSQIRGAIAYERFLDAEAA